MISRYEYLNAFHIIRMYEKENEGMNMISQDPIPYVKIEGTAMMFNYSDNKYYRHAGAWGIKYKYLDGILVADCDYIKVMKDFHEKQFERISFDEWYEQNKEWLDD